MLSRRSCVSSPSSPSLSARNIVASCTICSARPKFTRASFPLGKCSLSSSNASASVVQPWGRR
eukprot:4225475-Lingulodinium_polyedra.AAC.1